MNDFARAHNAYLEPPDEPEAVFCEECGEEMTVKHGDMICTNQYCPAKFEGVAKEMAELLIGAREEVKSLARRIHREGATCDECGNMGIIGNTCPNCGARRK